MSLAPPWLVESAMKVQWQKDVGYERRVVVLLDTDDDRRRNRP